LNPSANESTVINNHLCLARPADLWPRDSR